MTIAQHFDGFSGLSPEDPLSPSSTSHHHNNHLSLFDGGDDTFDLDDTKPSTTKPKSSSSAGQGRKGPGAADKRATHNAIERARRESLNGRFMTLAEALPSMAKVKRPSKSVIVQNALSFVYDAQVKEHALIRENNDLRRQVDQLRRQLGMPPLPPPAPLTGAGSVTPPAATTTTAGAAATTKPPMARHESFAESVASATSFTSGGGEAGALTMSMGQLDPSLSHSPPAMMHTLSPASGTFPSPPSSSGMDHHPHHSHHLLGTSPQLAGMFSTPGVNGVNATLFSPTVTSTTSLGDSPPPAANAGAFSPASSSSDGAGAVTASSSLPSASAFNSLSLQQAQAQAQAQAAAAAQAHHQHQQQLIMMHQAALSHQHHQHQHQQQQGAFGGFNPAAATSLFAANQQMFAAMQGMGGMGVGVGVGVGVNPFDLYGMSGMQAAQQNGAATGQQQTSWGSLGSEQGSAGQGAFGSFS